MNLVRETSKKMCRALFCPDNKKSLVPNWLSFVRAIGGIIIPVLSYGKASLTTLAGATAFIATSDFLDGKLARALNARSEDGALLDVISDKVFAASLIIGNIPRNKLFLINGALEGTISYINAKCMSIGGTPKSSFLGKVKIWPLSLALAASYVGYSLNGSEFFSLNFEELMKIGSTLSLITIPLEIINIFQYYNFYQKFKLEKANSHVCALYENDVVSKSEKVYKK